MSTWWLLVLGVGLVGAGVLHTAARRFRSELLAVERCASGVAVAADDAARRRPAPRAPRGAAAGPFADPGTR